MIWRFNLTLFFAVFFTALLFLFSSSGLGDDKLEETKKENRWIPLTFYTPETEVALGFMFIQSLKSSGTKPSSARYFAVATSRQQFMVHLISEMYYKKDRYRFSPHVFYRDFPSRFFGLGNETQNSAQENYSDKTSGFQTDFSVQIQGPWAAGFDYRYEHHTLKEFDRGGELEVQAGLFPTSWGLFSSGFSLLYNSLDNWRNPTGGFFQNLKLKRHEFSKVNSPGYWSWKWESRYFLQLKKGHTLGFQFLGEELKGEAIPFQKLLGLGGRKELRGFYSQRFRDRSKQLFQMEYRWDLSSNWGVVFFSGIGRVASRWSALASQKLHGAGGIGFRYLVHKSTQTKLRLDVGFAEGDRGIYFVFDEAF